MASGPETKKARWSPNSFTNSPVASGTRDLFANYGYGNQAAINQTPSSQSSFGLNGSSAANGLSLGNGQLYSTPSLTVNTATNGNGISSQISPSSATSPFPTMQNQQNGFSGYNMNGMLGMGMAGMSMLGVGGFPYSPQVGSFQQVCSNF